MNSDSTRFTEAHFDAKANRYQTAITSVPEARTLEILPFLLFLARHLRRDPMTLNVADLLCGSGFLTSGIKRCFGRVYGVDISAGMLQYYPVSHGVQRRKSALDEQSTILSREIKPDCIVALAGLHHVYEVVDGHVDEGLSDLLQQKILLEWANCLPKDGIMIVADVTNPAISVSYSKAPLSMTSRSETLTKQFVRMSKALELSISRSFITNGRHELLGEYVESVATVAPPAARTSPGSYFREVVAKDGIYGHVDNFLNPAGITNALNSRGYGVEYYELPTPWLFPSIDEFIFFFYEKFALGPQVDSFDDIRPEFRAMIKNSADRYLGLIELEGGAVSVGWRLGYYVVYPPTS